MYRQAFQQNRGSYAAAVAIALVVVMLIVLGDSVPACAGGGQSEGAQFLPPAFLLHDSDRADGPGVALPALLDSRDLLHGRDRHDRPAAFCSYPFRRIWKRSLM
jgi:hypothetical protein